MLHQNWYSILSSKGAFRLPFTPEIKYLVPFDLSSAKLIN